MVLSFIVNATQRGEDFGAGGRVPALLLLVPLELLLIINAGRSALLTGALLLLPVFAFLLAGSLVFAFRFTEFALSFAFLLVFLGRLGLFSLAF